jgi:hypothetical protein
MRGKAGSFELTSFHKTLIRMWDKGKTYADMVSATGRTKGSVAGALTTLKDKNYITAKDLRNHRRALGLEPVRDKPKQQKKKPGPLVTRLPKPAPVNSSKRVVALPRPVYQPEKLVKRASIPCCWPLGDPRDRDNFRYCDSPEVPVGKVYCAKHEALSRGKPWGKSMGSI